MQNQKFLWHFQVSPCHASRTRSWREPRCEGNHEAAETSRALGQDGVQKGENWWIIWWINQIQELSSIQYRISRTLFSSSNHVAICLYVLGSFMKNSFNDIAATIFADAPNLLTKNCRILNSKKMLNTVQTCSNHLNLCCLAWYPWLFHQTMTNLQQHLWRRGSFVQSWNVFARSQRFRTFAEEDWSIKP